MRNALIIAAAAGSLSPALAHAELLGYGIFEFEMNASSGTTITVTSHTVWANAAAAFDCLSQSCPPEVDSDPCVHPTSCNVGANAVSQACESGVTVYASSNFGALGPSRVSWSGDFIADGNHNQGCDVPLYGWGAGVGFYFEFTTDGDVTIEPPDCPAYVPGLTPPTNGREVNANILCLPSGPIASSLTQIGTNYTNNCATTTTVGAGSYTTSAVIVVVNDSDDDVTGDGRFNQDDVDYLNSIAPSAMPVYTDRFDFDQDGVMDSNDIATLQCFVDACLDARRIGDADCDNDVDCDDLTAVLAQDFMGESFDDIATTYKVGFDVDLDGDNDADDWAAMRDIFLEVEPANFSLDGSLDFFDYSEFLTLYNANNPIADMNGDGNWNFFDVSLFLQYYGAPNCLAVPNP